MRSMEIEMAQKNSPIFNLESKTGTFRKTSGGSISFKVTRNFIGEASVRFYVTGGKAQSEDWGFGKHFDGTGSWVNDGYEKNYTVVQFSGSETSKTVTLSFRDNGTLEPNKVLSVYLANPSRGTVAKTRNNLNFIDDRVDYVINVLSPGNVCGHDLSMYALDNTGETNNRSNLQAILDHFKNYHSGKNIIIYFPAGTYQFRRLIGTEGEIIKVPTVSNRITFVGEVNPINRFTDVNQPIDNLSGLSHIYMYADNGMSPSDNRWTRLFTTYKAGYIWSGSNDDYRIGFLNLVLDGKADEYDENGRPNASSLDQQKLAIFGAGTGTGKMISVVESCHTRLTAASAIAVMDYVGCRFYNLVGHNHFIGFFTYVTTANGTVSNLTAKKCYGSWPYKNYRWCQYDQAGFDSEPNAFCSGSILLEDCQFGAKLQFGTKVASGKQMSVVARRVKVIDPKSGDEYDAGASIAAHQDATATSTLLIEDCDLLLNTRFRQFNTVSVYRTKFIGYAFTDWSQEVTPYYSLLCNGRDNAASTLYFEDCFFDFYNYSGQPLNKRIFGLVTDKDDDKNDLVHLVRPTFGSGLEGAVYGNYNLGDRGTPERIIENPVMNISGGPSLSAAYVIYAASSSYAPQILTIKGGNYNSAPFMWAHGFWSNPDRHLTIIKFENLVLTKDKNVLLTGTYGFSALSYMPTSAKHASAMIRGTTTTVSCINHGLQVGDKIMFDAIGVTEWKNALCPDANVPLFQVTEVVNANTFRFNYNSSGLSADYDGNSDLYGAFFKPPVRLIIGDPGDNPIMEKPAGFAGDLYQAGSIYYRCKTSGVAGSAVWEPY